MSEPVDKGLLKLRTQIDEMAPDRRRGSDGFKGDAAHAARASDHNPETDPPPGNPDDQIDAGDYTHDPAGGADMGRISERIRLSRDRRVKYVIFSRRIFYGYDRPGLPAFTWTEYSGDNPHTLHMHVSVNDVHHDETQDWSIGMNQKDEKALISRVDTMIDMELVNPYGDNGQPEPNRLAEAINGITVSLNSVAGAVADMLPKLARMAQDMEAMRTRLDSLEQGPAPVYAGTATLTLQVAGEAPDPGTLEEIDRGGQ